jgi:hypothetical protein
MSRLWEDLDLHHPGDNPPVPLCPRNGNGSYQPTPDDDLVKHGPRVLICRGPATGEDHPDAGKYLRAYYVDAHDGRGIVTWTSRLSQAMRFVDLAAAHEAWVAISTVGPKRSEPSRPLTAFTVTIAPIPAEKP